MFETGFKTFFPNMHEAAEEGVRESENSEVIMHDKLEIMEPNFHHKRVKSDIAVLQCRRVPKEEVVSRFFNDDYCDDISEIA